MKVCIHYNDDEYSDSIVLQGETIKELQAIVKIETRQRGWDVNKCWSEEIK